MPVGTQLIDKHLIELGLITEAQLQEARLSAAGSKRPILDELIELGYLTDDQAVAAFRGADPAIELVDLRAVVPDPSVTARIPYTLSQRYSALPIEMRDGQIVVAMTNPWDLMATDDLALAAGELILPVLARRTELLKAIEELYNLDRSVYDLFKNLASEETVEITADKGGDERAVAELQADAGAGPVIRVVNLVISDALKKDASDIHIEPTSEQLVVRYRVDGVLRTVLELSPKLGPPLISRIKILAEMDIAERRKPQDGRIKARWHNRDVDIRVSVVPTYTGEKAALRLLTFAGAGLSLDAIGFPPEQLALYRRMLSRPQGILLITGPTGSGKTSTIYASLLVLNDGIRNITTVEDPVEYQLDGVNQIQINALAGVTFPSTLRSILRQDPNVIFVGEIRDGETAEIAFQSAQTGHLVISALHTNSAVASYTRLLDMGVEPFLISSSVLGIVAQRLVRKICPHCKTTYRPQPDELRPLRLELPEGATLWRGEGCAECDYTGFRGRRAVFEIVAFSPELRRLAAQARPEAELVAAARAEGMRMLAEQAAELVLSGITTAAEAAAHCPNEVTEAAPAPQPAASAPAGAPASAPPLAEPTARRTKPAVLIVDDDPAVRLLFSRTIAQDPVEVHTAENGKEALRLAHDLRPDLIVLDVMMPIMDGMETCRLLKSDVETASIPVIMATAKSRNEDEIEGLRAGADDYLVKPVMPAKLRLHVLKHLGRKYPELATATTRPHTADPTRHAVSTPAPTPPDPTPPEVPHSLGPGQETTHSRHGRRKRRKKSRG
jgi:type IV pilus assembly protein PilB